MKKIMLLTAGIMLFCIVPIASTQAMPCRVAGEDCLSSAPPNAVMSAGNQKKLPDMVVELGNLFSGNIKELHGKAIARGDKRWPSIPTSI